MYKYVAKGLQRQRPSLPAKQNQKAVSDNNTCLMLVGLEIGLLLLYLLSLYLLQQPKEVCPKTKAQRA